MPGRSRERRALVVTVMAVSLSACPRPAAFEPGAAQPPGPAAAPGGGTVPCALRDGFACPHPRLALLGRVGDWKTSLADPWSPAAHEDAAPEPLDLLVAAETPEAIRVVEERGNLRCALWVRPEELRLVPTSRVVLSPAPDEAVAGDGPGVQLAPGAIVETLERKDGWVLFRMATPEASATGWAPESRVGRVFERNDFNIDSEVTDREPAAGTEVFDRPDGAVLAVLRPDEEACVQVKSLGPAVDGWREVLLPTELMLVRGWVREAQLTEVGEPLRGLSGYGMGGYGVSDVRWLDLPQGTAIRTAPGGEIFAIAEIDTPVIFVGAAEPDGLAVGVMSMWGEVPGWAACRPPPPGAPWVEHVPCDPLATAPAP